MRIVWHEGSAVSDAYAVVFRDNEEIATVHWRWRTAEHVVAIDEERFTAHELRTLARIAEDADTMRAPQKRGV